MGMGNLFSSEHMCKECSRHMFYCKCEFFTPDDGVRFRYIEVDDVSSVDEIISLINFTNEKLDKVSEDLETYDDDSEADHGDGRRVGREEAYLEVLRECGRRLQKI